MNLKEAAQTIFGWMGKVLEASLPFDQSNNSLHQALRKALMEAHEVKDTWDSQGPYVYDIFPNSSQVVYSFEGQMYRRSYTSENSGNALAVTVGKTSQKCHVAYADSKESVTESFRALLGVMITPDGTKVEESSDSVFCLTAEEFLTIKESKNPAKIPIKIVKEGWGSSAYYSKEVLKRDGPGVFKKGTQMFWNHATETQESERPEGDLNDLAGVMTKDAYWDDNGPKGPGLYSEAKIFSDYATQVQEKGPHIGISLNAYIKCHEGEAEGRSGKIADKFLQVVSTDFVTKAGAGGAPIVPVLESQRRTVQENNGGSSMTPEEIKALADLQVSHKALEAENAKLKKGQDVILAVATVGAVLKEAEIPFSQKLLERACADPVMKEGKVDADWAKSIIADFSEEVSGRVTGMGARESAHQPKDQLTEAEQKAFSETMSELGVSEAGLKFATAGR